MKKLTKLLTMIPFVLNPLVAEDRIPPSFPTVTLASDSLEKIQLKHLSIVTNITENIAQTTYEMGFYNPNDRVLEGELIMPLLEGQAVVGYALEINGNYRDAVVVPKAKAKESYENTIRQQIDPAIMEKTLGNNYKLRLYPIPSKGVKKLKVTVEELLVSKEDSYRYTVPFTSDEQIAHFSLDVCVLSSEKPILQGFISKEKMEASSTGYFVTYKKQNLKLDSNIKLEIPQSSKKKIFFQTSNKEDNWFMALVEKRTSIAQPRTLPKSLELIWDSSLNLAKRDLEKEFALLENIFSKVQNCTVLLKRLDIAMHDEGSYRVVKGDWQKLKKRLLNIQYNGAKDLSQLKVDEKVDEVLFFSNGVSSFSDNVFVPISQKVITINSALVADHNNLKYISDNYINLVGLDDEEAFQKYLHKSKEEIVQASKNLSDIYIKDLEQNFLVLGRIDGKAGSLMFKSQGNEYNVTIDAQNESKLLARVWAKEKIDELSLRYKNNKSQITQLSKEYTIMTKESALIVLDRVEDYVAYEIVPPKELQEEYYRLLDKHKDTKNNEKERAIKESIALLEEQLVWYKKDFLAIKKERKKLYVEESLDEMGSAGYDMIAGEVEAAPPIERSREAQKSSKVSKKMKPQLSKEAEKQINLKEWTPNAPYLKAIQAVANKEQLQHYYLLQKEYRESIPFYVDMADFFHKKGQKEMALLILSNILELDFENSEYLRVFAFKLLELKFNKIAVPFFEKVAALRPFEAQASRDLALSYERVERYQEALHQHYHILSNVWHSRFSGIKIVTINEMNRLISMQKVDTSKIDTRLIVPMPVGMRIVINWSTDNTDMDLWVIDPNDEKTYYAHKESSIGGKISNDMTQGYGPEEFMMRKVMKGKYKIKVKYFASSAQKVMGETVIRAEVYTDYATSKEKMQEIVFRVKEEKDVIDIGEIVY